MKKLGELSLDIRYGFTATAQNNGTHRFVRITDVTNEGRLKSDAAKFVTPDPKEAEKYSLHVGDVLIARSGSVGRPLRICESLKGVFASYLIRFQLDPDLVRPEYVFYYCLSPQYNDFISDGGRGAAIKNINAKVLGQLEIPVPPLSEQRRIVARIKELFERVDEIRRLREEALREAEAVFASVAEKFFSSNQGEEKAIGEVCSIEGQLVDPREDRFQNNLHVGGANIISGTGELHSVKTAAEQGLKSAKYTFTTSDVLYSKIRPYLKKVARPNFDGLSSADIYPLRPKSNLITRDYLFYLLLSRQFTEYLNP